MTISGTACSSLSADWFHTEMYGQFVFTWYHCEILYQSEILTPIQQLTQGWLALAWHFVVVSCNKCRTMRGCIFLYEPWGRWAKVVKSFKKFNHCIGAFYHFTVMSDWIGRSKGEGGNCTFAWIEFSLFLHATVVTVFIFNRLRESASWDWKLVRHLYLVWVTPQWVSN